MKLSLILIFCHLSALLFCQAVIEGSWTLECGASTNTFFKKSTSLNFRYISPRFRWSDEDLTVEEEKHIEKLKKSRLMIELIYGPPLKVLCTALNVQHRFLKCKRFSVEAYGGLKFFFIPGPYFATIRPLRAGREAWYFNAGLLCQLNLGMIAPFADIGYDGIITIGSEFNFHAIYRNPKRRYRLHTRPD